KAQDNEHEAKEREAGERAQRVRAEQAEAGLEVKSEQQRRDLVLANTQAADGAFADTNPGVALERLERVPGDLRGGFEWPYRRRLFHGGIFTLYGHRDEVTSVVFSPDGTRLATASLDGTARVWDARTGQELLVIKGRGQAVYW